MCKAHGEWVLTDPDCVQVRRQFYDDNLQLWELATIREWGDGRGNIWYETCSQMIDLNDYTDIELKEMIEVTYGRDIEAVEYGEVAEMFFECCDDYNIKRHATWNDAVSYVERWTGLDLSDCKE